MRYFTGDLRGLLRRITMKLKLIAVMLLLALMCGCSSAKEEGADSTSAVESEEKGPDFTLINMTDREITSVKISVANMEKWSGNVLDGGDFYRGSEAEIEYGSLSDAEMYDIRCTDKDGNEVTYTELPLSLIKSIMLTVDESGTPVPVITEKDGAVLPEESDLDSRDTTEASSDEESTEDETGEENGGKEMQP